MRLRVGQQPWNVGAVQVAAAQEELAGCRARLDARGGEVASMKRLLAGALQPRMPADPVPRLISLDAVARAAPGAARLPPLQEAGRSAAPRRKDSAPPAAQPSSTHAAPAAPQPGSASSEHARVTYAPPAVPARPEAAVEDGGQGAMATSGASVDHLGDAAVTVSISGAAVEGKDVSAKAASDESPAARGADGMSAEALQAQPSRSMSSFTDGGHAPTRRRTRPIYIRGIR